MDASFDYETSYNAVWHNMIGTQFRAIHVSHCTHATVYPPLWRGQPRRLPALKKFRHALLWFGITNCSRLPKALPSANGLWYTQCLLQSWVVLNNKLKRHNLCRKRLSSISICGGRSKTNHCMLITEQQQQQKLNNENLKHEVVIDRLYEPACPRQLQSNPDILNLKGITRKFYT